MHGYFSVLLDSGKGRSRDISKHKWVLRIILWICTQITINCICLKDCMQFSNEQFGIKKNLGILLCKLVIFTCLFLLIGLVSPLQQTPHQSRHQRGKTWSCIERELHRKRPGKFSRRPLTPLSSSPSRSIQITPQSPKDVPGRECGCWGIKLKHSDLSQTQVLVWALMRPLGSLYPQKTDFCRWMSSSFMPLRLRTKKT